MNGDGRPDIFVAGLRGHNARSRLRGTASRTTTRASATCSTSTRATTRTVTRASARSARSCTSIRAPSTGSAPCSRRQRRRPARPLRRERREPEPALPERARPGGVRADPLGLGFRLEERAARRGIADPTRAWGSLRPTTAATGGPIFSSPTRTSSSMPSSAARRRPAGMPAFADARSDIAPAFDTSLAGWGVSWVDLDNDSNLDLVLTNGAIPVAGLTKSAEPVQAFENLTAHGHPGRVRQRDEAPSGWTAPRAQRPWARGRRLRQRRPRRHRGQPVGGKLVLLHNTGTKGNWLEVTLPAFAPGAVVTAVLPDGRRLVDELHAGAATSRPRIRAPTSDSGRRSGWTS